MPHNAAFHQGLHCLLRQKKIIRQKNTVFFINYNLTSLDMYNGLSQVYCIKPEGGIQIVYKGFTFHGGLLNFASGRDNKETEVSLLSLYLSLYLSFVTSTLPRGYKTFFMLN